MLSIQSQAQPETPIDMHVNWMLAIGDLAKHATKSMLGPFVKHAGAMSKSEKTADAGDATDPVADEAESRLKAGFRVPKEATKKA